MLVNKLYCLVFFIIQACLHVVLLFGYRRKKQNQLCSWGCSDFFCWFFYFFFFYLVCSLSLGSFIVSQALFNLLVSSFRYFMLTFSGLSHKVLLLTFLTMYVLHSYMFVLADDTDNHGLLSTLDWMFSGEHLFCPLHSFQ